MFACFSNLDLPPSPMKKCLEGPTMTKLIGVVPFARQSDSSTKSKVHKNYSGDTGNEGRHVIMNSPKSNE